MGGFAFVISIILYIGLYLKGRGIKLNDILDKRIMQLLLRITVHINELLNLNIK